jgi:hypothetical protein
MSVDDLAAVAEELVAAAALRHVRHVPVASNGLEVGQIRLDATLTSIQSFADLAAAHGGGLLYVEVEPPTATWARVLESEPDHPHAGQVGRVRAAFLAGGAAHVWEQRAAWFDEEFEDGLVDLLEDEDPDADGPDVYPAAENIRELAEYLLTHAEFRASRRDRWGIGRRLVPAGTEPLLTSQAVSEAERLAVQRGAAAHEQLRSSYPELARALVTSPPWAAAASAAGRRRVTEEFLTQAGDGYPPSATDRDELYGQARRVDEAARRAPQLF